MSREKSIFILINPAAGKGNIKTFPKSNLIEAGYKVEEQLSRGLGDCTRRVRKALKNGFTTIVIVGGDGTINEAVNGFFEDDRLINPSASLAFYPSGTGSDFGRTVLKNCRKMEKIKLLEMIENGIIKKVDTGKVIFKDKNGRLKQRYFVNVMDGGLGAETAYLVNKKKKKGEGLLTYLKQVFAAVFRYRNRIFKLKVDGVEKFSAAANTAVVANGKYFGGGLKIAPDAEVDSGYLEVVLLADVTVSAIFLNLYRLFTGSIYQHPKVLHFRAKTVEFSAEPEVKIELDGETPGFAPVKAVVCPKSLNLLLPRQD